MQKRALSNATTTKSQQALGRGGSQEPSKRKVMKQRISPDASDLIRGDGICAAYCVPSAVSLSRVGQSLKDRVFWSNVGDGEHVLFRTYTVAPLATDVVHVDIRGEGARNGNNNANAAAKRYGHAFCFNSGAVVCWGLPADLCSSLMDVMAVSQENTVDTKSASSGKSRGLTVPPTAEHPVRLQDFEHEFRFTIDSNRIRPTFRHDEIRLADLTDASHLLALSYGLAQSVRLLLYEEAIDSLVARTRQLPDELASRGQVLLSRGELRRLIGELLAARYSVLLVSDILDTPEFFWQHADLERVHLECTSQVELRERARLLDARTEVIKDALAILNSEVSASASDRVERAILFLIGVEVAIEVAKGVFTVV